MASRSRKLRKDTRELLAGLGASPNAVADSLGKIGVSGTPIDPEHCALSNYLQLIIGAEQGIDRVRVCNSHVFLWMGARAHRISTTPRRRIAVALPLAVRQFIAAFDERFYPDLVQKEPATKSGQQPPIRPSSET